MPTPKPPDPAEFRRQMVELVRAGRKPAQLAREACVIAPQCSKSSNQMGAGLVDARTRPSARQPRA